MTDSNSIQTELHQYEPNLIAFRKAIHTNPEVGFETTNTLFKIKEFLAQFGITGLDTETAPGSGFLLIEGEKPGKTIALRADIDALPIKEKSGCAWSSANNFAHACGHDGHMTWLLGAILYLNKHRNFAGRILCVFQANEENVCGAQSVIDSGVFKKYDVSEIYGAHNEPLLDVGTFGFRAGPTMAAADRFEIEVHGQGTHGARPNLGRDPLPGAMDIYSSFQSIVSRTVDPLKSAVISVCKFNTIGAESYNIISGTVKMLGTTRTFEPSVRDLVQKELIRRAEGISNAYGLECSVAYDRLVGPVINDPSLTAFAQEAASELFGASNAITLPEPYMISEDFSAYQTIMPGCFFFIGVKDKEHQEALHSPYFDFNDKVIIDASALFAFLALKRLGH